MNAPVCDGWITEKAEAGERGQFGDKSRVMASPPHLRESRLSMEKNSVYFPHDNSEERKGNERKTDLAAFYTWNLRPGLVVIGCVSQSGAARCGP